MQREKSVFAHVISAEPTEFVQVDLYDIILVCGNCAIFSSHQSGQVIVNAIARIVDVMQREIVVFGVDLLVREACWHKNRVADNRHVGKARHIHALWMCNQYSKVK